MADEALGNARRAASAGDAEALLTWCRQAWRSGEQERALALLGEAHRQGAASAGELSLELLRTLSAPERNAHALELAALTAGAVPGAEELLVECAPALRRIGARTGLSELHRQVCAGAIDDSPVRLASRQDEDQALVAACLHALRSHRGLLVVDGAPQCPSETCRDVEHWFQFGHWATVFVYGLTHSHYSRLVDEVVEFCQQRGTKAIFGIRLDSWDGEEFSAFQLGREIELPQGVEHVPLTSAARLFSQLLEENLRSPTPASRASHDSVEPFGALFFAASRLARTVRQASGQSD